MISIRKFKKGDERGIMKLTKLLFPNFNLSLKQWQWRHHFDKNRIVVSADEQNNIIGHWAYIKKNLLGQCGKKYKAGLTLAAMIHPQWQGKGIFSKMTEIFFKNAHREKIDFLYGFPNETFLPIHLHFGFLYIKPYNIYTKGIEKRASKDFEIEKQKDYIFVQKNNTKDIGVNNGIISGNIGLIKNASYLKQRYLEKPKSNYFLYEIVKDQKEIGYLVFKLYLRGGNRHLQLIDIDINSSFVKEDLLQCLYNFWYSTASKKKVDMLSTWKQNLVIVEDKIIRQHEFDKDQEKFFHLTIKGIRLDQNSMKILQKKPWNIKMGDTEIF